MITPDMLARSGSEDGEQAALMQQCALHVGIYPELKWLYHIPNGGGRGSDKAEASKNGAAMKRLGTKKGVLDLHLPVPKGNFACLYIEMKKRDGRGELSPEQIEFINFVSGQHAAVAICDTWRDAWHTIEQYLSGQLVGAKRGILDVKGYMPLP